jgi:hypothetical protein
MAVTLTMKTQMNTLGGITYNIVDRLKPDPNTPNGFLREQWAIGTGNVNPGAEIAEDTWPKAGQWHVPPSTIQVFHKGHTPMTNTAAAISTVLTAADSGIVPGTYEVALHTGLRLPDFVNVDSTGGSDQLSVGPSHTLSECTSQNPMTGEFLQHVLPFGFVKIRHYGLLASGNVATRLERARALLRPRRAARAAAVAPAAGRSRAARGRSMTDTQTLDDADALVTLSCTRTVAVGAIRPPKTAFTSVGEPVGCQVLVHPTHARVRIGRKAPSFAPAALPRSP